MKISWIVLALAGLVSIAVVFMWFAVDRPVFRELSRAVRPGPDDFAVVHEINPGATVGFKYAVHLLTIKDAINHRRGSELWNSYIVKPRGVVWAGPDTLEVLVEKTPECREYGWSIHEHGRGGIRVRTVWVEPGDSTAKP
jgi:hypothetical protein